MRHNDLAEYLDHDPFLEQPAPRQKAASEAEMQISQPKPGPVPPEKPARSAETERQKHESDVLRMVMEVFEGAIWTTREAYRRLASNRDKKGRRRRA